MSCDNLWAPIEHTKYPREIYYEHTKYPREMYYPHIIVFVFFLLLEYFFLLFSTILEILRFSKILYSILSLQKPKKLCINLYLIKKRFLFYVIYFGSE